MVPFSLSMKCDLKMLLLFLLISWAAASCPPHLDPACDCVDDRGNQWYSCRVGDSQYRVKARLNAYAKITCKTGPLVCPGMPYLPISNNLTLPSLHVQSCSLNGSLACVARSLHAEGARTLRVTAARGQLGDEHLAGLEGVENIDLENAPAETSLPLDLFARLPSLHEVTISGGHLQLSAGPWPDDHHLRTLTLQDDGIEELPEGAFRSLKNLTHLALPSNKMRSVDGAFKGLENLQFLDLSDNPLEQLTAASLTGLSRLRNLTLVLTSLRVIRSEAFRELRSLRMLHIYIGRSNLTLEDWSLANLPSLRGITVSETPLASLPEHLLHGSAGLEEVTMAECGLVRLPGKLFEGLKNLVSLDLKKNKLEELDEKLFWDLKRLEKLDLSHNELASLPENIFAGLTDLEHVHLDYNELVTFAPATFHGHKQLLALTISHNQLTLLKDTQPDDVMASPFMPLVNLQRLDLSWNQISLVFDDWRVTWIHEIKDIDLSWNKIRRLRAKDLDFNAKVRVDLRHNEISTIDLEPHLTTRATFHLDYNPFLCDCHLYSFLNYTRNNTSNFVINEATCKAPTDVFNKSINIVPLESLICNVIESCPEGCICFKRPSKSELELQCLNPPEVDNYTNPQLYDLSRTKLKLQHIVDDVELPAHVYSLNITNSAITEIPKIPDSVQELDLRLNDVDVIQNWVLERNLTLFLPNNTLKCDCYSVDFMRQLRVNSVKVNNFKDLACNDGRSVDKIDVESLCDVYFATVIGGSLATVGVLAMIIALVIYRYSKELKIYIYIMGWDRYLHKIGVHVIYEEEIDEKIYDVMLSYSDEKEKYIAEKFVPILEDEGYSVCVRYRDWEIGEWIPGKVAHLVEKSRRTVVFVTKDYLSSIASLELQAALMCEKRERRKRVLLIATEDLEPDPHLKAFLETRKSLNLEDERFWSRLRMKLPRRREERVRKNRMTQKTLNVLMTAEGASYVLKRTP